MSNFTNTICAIYTRVSTEKQREKYSLSAQKKILTEYAQRQGWEYIIYDEGAGSGETIIDRPKIFQLLEDARYKKFNICLVIELERLSRDEDLFDWLTIKKVFRENNVKIATPNQMFDLNDDEDDFMSDLLGALAKREKKKFLKRAKRGSLEAVRQGKYIGNHFRLGYKYNKETQKLEIVLQESEVVKLVFKLCNEDDFGLLEIADYLNTRGIPTILEFCEKRGTYNPTKKDYKILQGRWTGGVIYRILTNPIYYGEYYYNRYTHKDGKKVKRPQEEWVKMNVEPIITKEEFDIAQQKLNERSKWRNRHIKNQYLLTGLLYCGNCGNKLQGVTYKAYEKRDKDGKLVRNKRGYLIKRWKTNSYYKCYGRASRYRENKCTLPLIRVEVLDKLIWEEISNRIKQPQEFIDAEIKRQWTEVSKQKENLPNKLNKLEKELRKIKIAIDRVLDSYAMQDIERPEFKKQMTMLKDRRRLLEKEIENIKLRMGDNKIKEEKLKGISDYLTYVKGVIDYFTWEDKREFLHKCIYKVIIKLNGEVIIDGAINLSTGEQYEPIYSQTGKRCFCSSGQS